MKKKTKKKKNRLTKKEEGNMTCILHGGMEGLKIEMKCGLVFRPSKERGQIWLWLYAIKIFELFITGKWQVWLQINKK